MPDLTELSDSELISTLALHDEDAFAELFRRHSSTVAKASRMILGSHSSCDDVVAEVFLALWLTPQSFDPTRGSLQGYLRVKAKGKSIDIVRAETARVRREQTTTRSQQNSGEIFTSGVLESERTAIVADAIATLESNEREPIELAFYKGMPYRTIATYLQIPEGTTKSRIRSGLRHLREHIEAQRLLEARNSSAKLEPTG